MLLMLTFLPLILKSVFSGFRTVQDNLYPPIEITEVEEPSEPQPNKSLLGGFFARKPTVKQLEDITSILNCSTP